MVAFQIHCSMNVLHTYAVCYSYIIVGVGYLFSTLSPRKSVIINNDILQLASYMQ